jgi:DMSO/TMAO reductase YedYZ molybdopterin-dependent catalytic subunit
MGSKKILILVLIAVIIMGVILVISACNIRGNIIYTEEESRNTSESGSVKTENDNSGNIDTDKDEESTGDLILKLQERQDEFPGGAALGGAYPEVDGLHVTGTPIAVSISQYRLEVRGAVENPLSLTFEEVKEMESVRKYIVLECPGFFTDEGYWTGVEVRRLLEMAVVTNDASEVRFRSLDGNYSRALSLETIMENDGIIIAYHFNDKEFSDIHGYPLRVAADGQPGYIWVKWLGEIEVLTEEQAEGQQEDM